MFFKSKKQHCGKCDSHFSHDYSYCPYCGNSMVNPEKESVDYGMLGRTDAIDEDSMKNQIADANMGFIDKIVESTFQSIMKSMEKEMQSAMQSTPKANITRLPNGVKIRISPTGAGISQPAPAQKKQIMPKITTAQLERMSKMPRAKAKANIRRLSNKIIYEMNVPGLSSLDDVFVSKLEKGYEIKAIGQKKIYANSLPLEMNLHSFKVEKDKLLVEFR